jgi:hypothetical protein
MASKKEDTPPESSVRMITQRMHRLGIKKKLQTPAPDKLDLKKLSKPSITDWFSRASPKKKVSKPIKPIKPVKSVKPVQKESSSEESSSEESSSEESGSEESSSEESSSEESSSEEEQEKEKEELPEQEPRPKKARKLDEKGSVDYTSYFNDEWAFPSMKRPVSQEVWDQLEPVSSLQTPYHLIIPFWFAGRPAYCPNWTKQFDPSLPSSMERLAISKKRARGDTPQPHWDLFPMWFSFEKGYEDGKRQLIAQSYLRTRDSEQDERVKGKGPQDLMVQYAEDLTIILRPRVLSVLRDRDQRFLDHMEKYLLMGTHHSDQRNIYHDVKDPMKAWIFHLILGEPRMKADCVLQNDIHIRGDTEVRSIKMETVLQCLYRWYADSTKKSI